MDLVGSGLWLATVGISDLVGRGTRCAPSHCSVVTPDAPDRVPLGAPASVKTSTTGKNFASEVSFDDADSTL